VEAPKTDLCLQRASWGHVAKPGARFATPTMCGIDGWGGVPTPKNEVLLLRA
jgi:hypothetical protein